MRPGDLVVVESEGFDDGAELLERGVGLPVHRHVQARGVLRLVEILDPEELALDGEIGRGTEPEPILESAAEKEAG